MYNNDGISMYVVEVNFDGLVGFIYNYVGLLYGNVVLLSYVFLYLNFKEVVL